MSCARIQEIALTIHDAAAGACSWTEVLREIARNFDATDAAIFTTDPGDLLLTSFRNGCLPAHLHELYIERFALFDTQILRLLNRPDGTCLSGADFLSQRELESCPVHREYLIPNGVEKQAVWHIRTTGGRRHTVALMRDGSGGPFAAATLGAMAFLVQHLKRALQVQECLAAAEQRSAMLCDALDQLAVGVVLVDRNGRVLHCNRRAGEIAARGDGLSIATGLSAATSGRSDMLRRLIAAAAGGAGRIGPGGAMSLPRASSARPLSLLVAPVGARSRLAGGNPAPCVAVFIADPDSRGGGSEQALRRLFDLTRREAQLAMAIAYGASLAEAARDMGVSVETARTHLRNVFLKTETHRQADLVRLLQSSIGRFRLG